MLIAYFTLVSFLLLLASVTADATLQAIFGKQIPALSRITVQLRPGDFLKVWHNGRTLCSVIASETTIFDCHCFPFVSSAYKLFYNDVFVTNFSVTEPNLKLNVPFQHKVCEDFNLTGLILHCDKIDFSIRLQYHPTTVLPQFESHFEDIISVSVVSPSTVLLKKAFVLPGIYRLLLETDGKLLKESNTIRVENTGEVSLILEQQSIFPHCKKNFKINWTHAKCTTSDLNFRLRIFAVPDGSTVERSYYLEEIHLNLNDNYALLPCSMFDIIYSHFCFELVSIQQSTLFFYSWHRSCIQTENLGHIDGQWSSWSNWSECSTSCGNGIRRRYRYCNKPSPKGSGAFCSHNFVESQNCTTTCPEAKKLKFAMDKRCSCGCLLNQVKGTFFAFVCMTSSRWILLPYGGKLSLYLHSIKTTHRFRLEVYDQPEKLRIFFDSGNTTAIRKSLRIRTTKATVIEILPVQLDKRIFGVQISYEWYNDSIGHQTFTLPSLLDQHQHLLYDKRYFLLAIFIVSVIIIFAPPILLAIAVKKKTCDKARSHTSLLDGRRMDCEMVRSGNTESTVLTADKVIAKRSIGIQLSTTSTPRLPRRMESLSRETSSVQQTPRLRHSSLSCFGDHELEYDYYEPAIPGSFLTPMRDFHSEIDIDQIIGQSCLRDFDVAKSDAITQA